MRISDWSSDVCSSDLRQLGSRVGFHAAMLQAGDRRGQCRHGAQGTGASALNADGLPKHAAIAWPPWRLMEVRATNAIDIRQRSCPCTHSLALRSEEHKSELQSLMRISYAVFCLKKKIT